MSNNVVDHPEAAKLRAEIEALKNGGGGGNFGDMETRVARLENDMSEIKGDLKAVRSDVSELKGKVSMLPGYPGIATIIAIVGGALLAISRLFPAGPP